MRTLIAAALTALAVAGGGAVAYAADSTPTVAPVVQAGHDWT